MTEAKEPRVIASIEARMGSSRLPGKVLMDVFGRPSLGRLFDRLRRARLVDDIVLATTTSPLDDALAHFAEKEGVAVFRGSEADVLQRVVEAHRYMRSEVIVEVTGDCPLLDPAVIDLGVETFLTQPCDVVTNVRELSWPTGADVQVFRFSDLEWVAHEIDDPAVREHVSLFFYENPSRFRIIHLHAPADCCAPDQRFQLDYPEDLMFIRQVYERLYPSMGDAFGTADILRLLTERPELAEINRSCEEKAVR